MSGDAPWGEFSVERYESALQTRVIGYELWSFATSIARINTVDGAFLQMNVLDACLLHARCCTEFLVGRLRPNGQRDWYHSDVAPRDFLSAWEPHPADAVEVLDSVLPLLDKHVAHVTTTRADLFGHRWDIDSLDRAIFAVAMAFRAQLAIETPQRFAELESWIAFASKIRTEQEAASPEVRDRTGIRSGLDLVMIPPQGIPTGVWSAWSQRYMTEKGIGWPQ